MFRSLCRKLLQIKTTKYPTTIRTTDVCFFQNSFARTISHTSDITNQLSPTVSYLIDSCGLSSEAALSAAQKLKLNPKGDPDSVLTLLKHHGFDKTHITDLITKHPLLLLVKSEKTLKPKLEFFQSVGFSGPSLAKLLCENHYLLLRSLENQIIPIFDILEKLLPTVECITNAIRRSPRLISYDLRKWLLPNVEILRNRGVPESVVSKLLMSYPATLQCRSDHFEETIVALLEMGINPLTRAFVHAVYTMCGRTRSTWDRKLAVYRSLGWSDDAILWAFSKQPACMSLSEEAIRLKMGFYSSQLKWGPDFISTHPVLLTYSLRKRIVPRCFVLSILKSKGLVKSNFSPYTALSVSEKYFLKRYVIKYQDEVPDILEAHQGKLGFVGFEMVCEEGIQQSEKNLLCSA